MTVVRLQTDAGILKKVNEVNKENHHATTNEDQGETIHRVIDAL